MALPRRLPSAGRLPGQSVQVHVAAAEDQPHPPAAEAGGGGQHGRQRHGARGLHDDLQPFPDEAHGRHDLRIRHRDDARQQPLEDGEVALAEGGAQAVGHGARIGLGQPLAGGQRAEGVVGAGGLGAHQFDALVADRARRWRSRS